MGTATACGWSVGETYAGSSIAPWGDVTLTTSPRAMPSFAAVSAAISTHGSHTAWVIVSGASWNHARPAPRPPENLKDGYASRASPSAVLSNVGGAGSPGARRAFSATAAVTFQ